MGFSRYKHRLTIQAPVRVQDGTTGELTSTWTTIATVWASIEPILIRSRELLTGDQILGETDTRIKMRWSPNLEQVTTAHRGLHQGSVFNFVSIAHVKMAQREIEITAKSGVNDG